MTIPLIWHCCKVVLKTRIQKIVGLVFWSVSRMMIVTALEIAKWIWRLEIGNPGVGLVTLKKTSRHLYFRESNVTHNWEVYQKVCQNSARNWKLNMGHTGWPLGYAKRRTNQVRLDRRTRWQTSKSNHQFGNPRSRFFGSFSKVLSGVQFTDKKTARHIKNCGRVRQTWKSPKLYSEKYTQKCSVA